MVKVITKELTNDDHQERTYNYLTSYITLFSGTLRWLQEEDAHRSGPSSASAHTLAGTDSHDFSRAIHP